MNHDPVVTWQLSPAKKEKRQKQKPAWQKDADLLIYVDDLDNGDFGIIPKQVLLDFRLKFYRIWKSGIMFPEYRLVAVDAMRNFQKVNDYLIAQHKVSSLVDEDHVDFSTGKTTASIEINGNKYKLIPE